MKSKMKMAKRILAATIMFMLAAGELGASGIKAYAAENPSDTAADEAVSEAASGDEILSSQEISETERPEASSEEKESATEVTDEEVTGTDETTDVPEAETDTESLSEEETSTEEPTEITEEADDVDLLGVTRYKVWVGNTQVTSENCDDLSEALKGTGAGASYDPDSKTLTFSGNVTGVKDYYMWLPGVSVQLYAEDELTIKGTAQFADADADFGIKTTENLTIDGDFEAYGKMGAAIYSMEDLTLTGNISAKSKEFSTIICEGDLVIDNAYVSAECESLGNTEYAIYAYALDIRSGEVEAKGKNPFYARTAFTISSRMKFTSPTDGEIVKGDYYYYVTEADGTTVPSYVKIEEDYGLYVGKHKVTDENKDDIPVIGENAKASYDPVTKTLTFSGGVEGVDGLYTNKASKKSQIYSDGDLTVKGNVKLKNTEADYGIVSWNANLILDGDFDIYGNKRAIAARENITLNGIVKASAEDGAIIAYEDIIVDAILVEAESVKNNAIDSTSFFIQSGTVIAKTNSESDEAIYASYETTFAPGFEIRNPVGGRLSDDGHTILDADGNTATNVEIGPIDSGYGIYVGSTPVTGENKDDIPGVTGRDAKASYDPVTKTLTFKNVTGIKGSYASNLYHKAYKIYIEGDANEELKIAGDAVIDGGCYGGIYAGRPMRIEGDITISNVRNGITAAKGLVNAGSLSVDIPASFPDGKGIDFSGSSFAVGGGKVTVTISGEDKTPLAGKDMTINGGTVSAVTEVPAGVTAIDLSGSFVMTDGTLIIKRHGDKDSAVYAEGRITLGDNAMFLEPVGGTIDASGKKIMCADVEHYAKDVKIIHYTEEEYAKVSFNSEYLPESAPADAIVKRGEKLDIPSGKSIDTCYAMNDPSHAKRFLGWYYDPEFTVKADGGDIFTDDTTLYARWIDDGVTLHTVTFSDIYHYGIPAQKIEDGGTAKEPVGPFIYEDQILIYWSLGNTLEAYDFSAPVHSDITLIPHTAKISKDNDFVVGFIGDWKNTKTGNWEKTYSGSGITMTPSEDIRITSVNGDLTEGVDYTLSYKNNTNVSTAKKPATVTVKGKGKYKGSQTLKYYVVPVSIVDEGGDLDTYNGFSMEPVVVESGKKISPMIYYNGKKLAAKDYELSNKNKVTADTAIDITGKGNFTGKLSNVSVKVLNKDAAKVQTIKVKLKAAKHTYHKGTTHTVTITKEESGTVTKGELTVTNGKGEILKEGTHFAVKYYNNADAGTAKIVVSGKDPYTGTVEKTFKITPDKGVVLTTGTSDNSYEFVTGGVTLPGRVFVTISDVTESYKDVYNTLLIENKDYKVSYSNNKAVSGTKKAKYKITFIGNYKGHTALNGEFEILKGDFASKKNFDGAKVAVSDMIYTKSAKYEPVPMVYIGSTLLKKTDYDVAYFDDEGNPTKGTKITLGDAEQYRRLHVVVTGKGNYKDQSVTKYFYVRKVTDGAVNLSKAKIATKGSAKKSAVGNQNYNASPICPEVDVYIKNGKNWELVNPAYYNVEYANNLNPGKATIIVTGKGGKAVGSKTATFKILQRNLNLFKLWFLD